MRLSSNLHKKCTKEDKMNFQKYRALGLTLTLLVVLSSCASSPASNPEAARRKALYMARVRSEGYDPTFDSDGDIRFTRNGLVYYVILGSNDPVFAYILLPGIYAPKSEKDQFQALEAIAYANRASQVGKAFLLTPSGGARVSCSVEFYLPDAADFDVLFPRFLSLLDNTKTNFDNRLRELR
jgi:hypothetical protein